MKDGAVAVESRFIITLDVPEELYLELLDLVAEDAQEELILQGVKLAIRKEQCRRALGKYSRRRVCKYSR